MSELDLTQLNVWLDVGFTTLYVVVVLALIAHFIISIPTGRFKKTWIDGHWPEHDEPHPPALPKFLHFQHLAMMFVLGFTGFYIRFPFFDGGRTTMRYIHYVAMVIVVINLLWRFWYAFYSKQRDWRAFAIRGVDARSTLGVMLYYAYLSKNKPHTDKYNVLQKGSYLGFAIMMIMQALCGFALLEFIVIPGTADITVSYILVGWWMGPIVGGTAMAVAYMRILHYILTWAFILMTTIHVYLSATIDIPVTLDFFGFGKHDDEHGDAHGHDAPAIEPAAGEAH
ncbi:MAG: cytochrome b/b6 domain-containing protein [Coriobacteriia bacterium]|nr:cytochrome b/b6 domain-containing protein [Coriobacteriia bacterium]